MEFVGHATHGWRMEGHHSHKYNRRVKNNPDVLEFKNAIKLCTCF
jgi:hypothetical protein